MLIAQNWLCVNAAAEGLQKRTEMMREMAASGSASESEPMGRGDLPKVRKCQKVKTGLK